MWIFVRSLGKTEVERHIMTNGLILRTLQPEAAQPALPEVLVIALFSASGGSAPAVILPDDASWAGDMLRAGSSFLIELVAKATLKPR